MASKLDEFDETQFNDADLDDPDLNREMHELEQEERRERAEEMTARLEEAKQRAVLLKNQGRMDEARNEMRAIMALKNELEALQAQILEADEHLHKHAMDLDSDEEAFDYNSIVSMGVMEHELNLAKQRGDEDTVATLELKIKLLTTNINMNLVSLDKYSEDIADKVKECKAMLRQAPPKRKEILMKHIELMNAELKHMEEEDSEEPMELDFDYGSIASMGVLEHELAQAQKRGDTDVADTLKLKIKVLTTNIEMGLISQEAYMESVSQKIKEYQKNLKTVSAEMKAIYQKHIEIMQNELSQQDEDEDEISQPPPPQVSKAPELRQPPPPPVSSVPEIPHEQLMDSNRTYRELYEVMEELKLAINYLRDLGHSEPIEGLLTKAESVHSQLSSIRRSVPFKPELIHLMPTDLTGMPEAERKSKIIELSRLASQLEEEQKQQAMEALKIKNREKAAKHKSMMMQYQQLQKDLLAAQHNPWQILPLVVQEQRIERKEVLNEDLADGQLEVRSSKMTGVSDSDEYYVYLTLGLSKTLILRGSSKYAKQIKTNGFNHSHIFEVDNKEWPMLDRRRLTFEVFRHRWIRSDESLGSAAVKLSDLAAHCTVQTSVPIGGRKGATLEATLRVRKAFKGNEFTEVKILTDAIQPMPPAFKQPNGRLLYQSRQDPSQTQSNLSVSQPTIQAPQLTQPARPASRNPQEESKTAVSNEASPGDLYPIDDIVCVGVLEQEVVRISALIKKKRSDGEDVRSLQALQQQVIRKKEMLKGQIGNGVISLQQYLEALEKQVASDMQLANAYKARGDRAALEVIAQRVKMTKQEITDIKSNI